MPCDAVSAKTALRPTRRPPALKFTVLYDNYVHQEGTKAEWGFSCLIQGAEKTILFDTGTKPEVLMHNVKALGVDLQKVDLVVISHDDGDHTGDLPAVLERNPEGRRAFSPFPSRPNSGRRSRERAPDADRRQARRDLPERLPDGRDGGRDQGDVARPGHPRRLVVVTGCSHPGIVGILRRAKEIRAKPIHLVFGGFHLGNKPDAEIQTIIVAFRS